MGVERAAATPGNKDHRHATPFNFNANLIQMLSPKHNMILTFRRANPQRTDSLPARHSVQAFAR